MIVEPTTDALSPPDRRVHLSTLVFTLTFFVLIFYFRNLMLDLEIPFTYLFLGMVALGILLGRTELLILLLLVITSTVFQLMEFPTVSIAIGDMYYSDLLIVALLVGRLLKKVTRDVTVIPKPMGYPILTLIIIAIFSFIYSTSGWGVPTERAGIELRGFVHFALFFLVIYYVRTQCQLRTLLLGFAMIAGLVAVSLVAQYALGSEESIVAGRIELLRTATQQYQRITRILVPGAITILFALITLIAVFILKALRNQQLFTLFGILILSSGLILTFTRVFWIMTLAATALLLFIARRKMIIYPRIALLMSMAVLSVVVVLQAKTLDYKLIKDAILNRTASILRAPTRFREDTLYMRYLESSYALKKIEEHPLLGIGLGNTYRPRIFGNTTYEKVMKGTQVHNGYLATQLKMGIPGTLVFFWLIIAFINRALKNWKRIKDPLYQAVVLGALVSVFGLLVHNLVASPFLEVYGASVCAVAMGVTEKILQFEGLS